jgi:hypothetical protein
MCSFAQPSFSILESVSITVWDRYDYHIVDDASVGFGIE